MSRLYIVKNNDQWISKGSIFTFIPTGLLFLLMLLFLPNQFSLLYWSMMITQPFSFIIPILLHQKIYSCPLLYVHNHLRDGMIFAYCTYNISNIHTYNHAIGMIFTYITDVRTYICFIFKMMKNMLCALNKIIMLFIYYTFF